MFLSDGIDSRPAPASDAVYMEIVGTLYGTLLPILCTGIGHAIVGAITVQQTGDPAMASLTCAGVVVAIVRAWGVLAFRRRILRQPPLCRAEAAKWERRYAAGSAITGLILGLFAARSLMLADAICSVMAIGIAFGFGAGVVARGSLRPTVAIVDLTVTGVPAIALTLTHLDAPHIGLGVLFTIFLVTSVEMVRLTYTSTINQMTLKRQFEQLARIDPMTGLLNRSVLDTDLVRMLGETQAGLVAVHAIDLDHFKAANDKFGHPVGDALLKAVAGRLKTIADEGDLVVRMGGDEFILVQKSTPGRDDAELTAQRIFQSISAPYCVAGHDITIGVSIGVAISSDDGQSVDGLLSRSDHALYRAKERRGGYVFAPDLPPQVSSPGMAPDAEPAVASAGRLAA
jgi:diguanylate cyclase (GGDEF)-like protein